MKMHRRRNHYRGRKCTPYTGEGAGSDLSKPMTRLDMQNMAYGWLPQHRLYNDQNRNGIRVRHYRSACVILITALRLRACDQSTRVRFSMNIPINCPAAIYPARSSAANRNNVVLISFEIAPRKSRVISITGIHYKALPQRHDFMPEKSARSSNMKGEQRQVPLADIRLR